MRTWMRGLIAALCGCAPVSGFAACSVGRIAEMPVTMHGLEPTVTAAVNGSAQTFILDSGAFYSLISPGAASDLGLKLGPAPGNMEIQGVGGSADAKVTTVRAFTFVGHTFTNTEFIVAGSEVGRTGLIGQNILGMHDIEYDLPHGMVRLMLTKDCAKTNLAYWAKLGDFYSVLPILDLRDADYHTIGTVMVNDISVKAVFDTGAALTTLSLRVAARAGLTSGMTGAKPGGPMSGVGRHISETWIVPVARIKIGDEELHKARIRIGDIGADTDMLIGADFFISHRVFVSNATRHMYFTYTGGPIFDLSAHGVGAVAAAVSAPASAGPPEAPLDAEALARRAAVAAARHDATAARADIDRAIALAPREPSYLLQRAALEEEADEQPKALADLTAAIALKGDDVDAHIARAALLLREKKRPEALADLDAAAAAAGKASDRRLALAELYEDADAFPAAIAQASQWIDAHPVDSRRADALNTRCWARALAGTELPLALADCTAALRLRPHAPNILDSRGLVELRMGALDKAIADYDAVLAVWPKTSWSLYGRGLAERAGGKADAAKRDMDAAVALNPDLPAKAKRYGIGG